VGEASLRGWRVLVVEDEYLIADAMERGLRGAGAIVLGPVPTVEKALELLEGEREVDGAVLDINLAGRKVFPVADALAARGIRFLFATGYDAADVPAAYRHVTAARSRWTPRRSRARSMPGPERRRSLLAVGRGRSRDVCFGAARLRRGRGASRARWSGRGAEPWHGPHDIRTESERQARRLGRRRGFAVPTRRNLSG
jgi:CheY-like chemotaxis protein